MELAIACDMIVAVAGAKFGQPEIKLAVFPPVAAVLLPRLIPPARAMEILLGGENLLAEEGKAIGLVNRVFPRETFAADVQFFLAPFMKLSRVALLSTRRAIREAAGKPFDTALDTVEHIYLKELMLTDDAKEGLAAFLEKRQPAWRNS
jgi:cyclohexa-1,5-dienecarbonyl-CoA hydratase